MTNVQNAIFAAGLALSGLSPVSAVAHFSPTLASAPLVEITGELQRVIPGRLNVTLVLESGDKTWIVQVGRPWRPVNAGLTDDLLQPGRIVTVMGEHGPNPEEQLIKGETVVIDSTFYALYPDRMQ